MGANTPLSAQSPAPKPHHSKGLTRQVSVNDISTLYGALTGSGDLHEFLLCFRRLVAAGLLTATGVVGHGRLAEWDEWQSMADTARPRDGFRTSAFERWHNAGKHATPKVGCPLCADVEASA